MWECNCAFTSSACVGSGCRWSGPARAVTGRVRGPVPPARPSLAERSRCPRAVGVAAPWRSAVTVVGRSRSAVRRDLSRTREATRSQHQQLRATHNVAFAEAFDHRAVRHIPIGADRWHRSKTRDRSRRDRGSPWIMSSRSGTFQVPVSRYNRGGRPVAFPLVPDGSVGSACPAAEISMIGNRAQWISPRPRRRAAAGPELRARGGPESPGECRIQWRRRSAPTRSAISTVGGHGIVVRLAGQLFSVAAGGAPGVRFRISCRHNFFGCSHWSALEFSGPLGRGAPGCHGVVAVGRPVGRGRGGQVTGW
jgi:hypothetical protein